jgi:hypothetical protein
MLILVWELGKGVREDGITVDEVLYVAAGYRHLTALDFRPCPSHPPLAKMLGAAGLLGLPLKVPEVTSVEGEWSWAFEFIHEDNDAGVLIRRARIVPCLLTVFLVLLIWSWGRALGGALAGLAAAALATFHPSLLAHGHLATTDMPGTLGLLAACWAFWRWTRRQGRGWAAAVAVLVGLTVTARLTGWMAVPIFGLLAALQASRLPPDARRAFAKQAAELAGLGVVIVPLVIWAVHGFRYAPWPGATVAHVPGPWLGFVGRVIHFLEVWGVLPEAYLEGARYQVEHNLVGHPGYLMGYMSNTGWRSYYLVAFAAKNTLGFLAGVLVAIVVLARRRAFEATSATTHWAVTAGVVFLSASLGRIQIGERYILPIYPCLILLVAAAVPTLVAAPLGRLAGALILTLHAASSLLAAPGGYISYFNAVAGGREGGHRVLLDSNLDWGQDLPRLARWMREAGVREIQLGYHGTDDPRRFGIECESLPGLSLYPGRPARAPFTGTVAVSPNLLMGLFDGPLRDAYSDLRRRPPDERAGIFFIYRLPAPRTTSGSAPGPTSSPAPP